MATVRPSLVSVALKHSPIPTAPMDAIISYGPSFSPTTPRGIRVILILYDSVFLRPRIICELSTIRRRPDIRSMSLQMSRPRVAAQAIELEIVPVLGKLQAFSNHPERSKMNERSGGRTA